MSRVEELIDRVMAEHPGLGVTAKRTATNCQHIVFPPNGSKISSVRCGERHCLPDDICGPFCQNECEFYKAPNFELYDMSNNTGSPVLGDISFLRCTFRITTLENTALKRLMRKAFGKRYNNAKPET